MNTTTEPMAFDLRRNPHGRLVLRLADGTEHEAVTPVRAFPIAAPQEGLSLVGADGHELAWVPRLDQLDEPRRALLAEALEQREFMPELRRVHGVSSFATPSTWDVDTDRGRTQFVLKGEEDIRRLSGRTKLLIAASDGLHFHVPDSQALDRASRRLLERFL